MATGRRPSSTPGNGKLLAPDWLLSINLTEQGKKARTRNDSHDTSRDRQTPDRHRQILTDTGRHKHTETDTDRVRQTQTDTDGHEWAQTDTDRQDWPKQTETNGKRR